MKQACSSNSHLPVRASQTTEQRAAQVGHVGPSRGPTQTSGRGTGLQARSRHARRCIPAGWAGYGRGRGKVFVWARVTNKKKAAPQGSATPLGLDNDTTPTSRGGTKRKVTEQAPSHIARPSMPLFPHLAACGLRLWWLVHCSRAPSWPSM